MSRAEDDANHRLEQLILLTDRLADLIRQETAALNAKRPSALGALLEEKAKIAVNYTRETNALRKDPMLAAAARDELKSALKEKTDAFRRDVAALEKTLRRLRHVGEGMIRAIAEEVHAKSTPSAAYGGSITPPSRRAVPIALDRRI